MPQTTTTKPIQVHPDVLKPFIGEISGIINDQLGKGYVTKDTIKRAIKSSNDTFIVVAFPDTTQSGIPARVMYSAPPSADTYGGKTSLPDSVAPLPAAVTFGKLFPASKFASTLNLQGMSYPSYIGDADPIALIKGSAVHKEAQGNGLGNSVVSTATSLLDEAGAEIQVAFGWRNRVGIYASEILEQNGFSAVREYDGYWREESLEKGSHCKLCGPPPCECSAILYTKD